MGNKRNISIKWIKRLMRHSENEREAFKKRHKKKPNFKKERKVL
jgi:hypothetical protein